MSPKLLTYKQVAAQCDISVSTVKRWAAQQRITVVVGPGGRPRVVETSVVYTPAKRY